jgi:hypothetical protein
MRVSVHSTQVSFVSSSYSRGPHQRVRTARHSYHHARQVWPKEILVWLADESDDLESGEQLAASSEREGVGEDGGEGAVGGKERWG